MFTFPSARVWFPVKKKLGEVDQLKLPDGAAVTGLLSFEASLKCLLFFYLFIPVFITCLWESWWDVPPLICKTSRRAAVCSQREDPGDSWVVNAVFSLKDRCLKEQLLEILLRNWIFKMFHFVSNKRNNQYLMCNCIICFKLFPLFYLFMFHCLYFSFVVTVRKL